MRTAALLLLLPLAVHADTMSPPVDWTSSYNGPGSELEAVHDIALRDGSLYVVGGATVDVHGMGYVTVKYAPDGSVAWSRLYEGFPGGTNQDDVAEAVAVDATGNVYVSGYSGEYSVSGSGTVSYNVDVATLKYSADGTLLWERHYRGSGDNAQPSAVVIDPRGLPSSHPRAGRRTRSSGRIPRSQATWSPFALQAGNRSTSSGRTAGGLFTS